MKRNGRKEELQFRYNMIRFTKAGDACRIFKGKHMGGGGGGGAECFTNTHI